MAKDETTRLRAPDFAHPGDTTTVPDGTPYTVADDGTVAVGNPDHLPALREHGYTEAP